MKRIQEAGHPSPREHRAGAGTEVRILKQDPAAGGGRPRRSGIPS
jgi:hypothetical protein